MAHPQRHVIVGNGAAGLAAAEAIRESDKQCSILILSSEPGLAYSKVLLHYLVSGEIDESGIVIRGPSFYRELGIGLSNRRVCGVDTAAQRIYLEDKESLEYDRLLIATGASAWRPPISGIDLPNVHCLWTLQDARALLSMAKRCRRAVVMGAGFVGIQATDALVARGARVTLIDVADRVLPLLLDVEGASMVSDHLLRNGVSLRLGTAVAAITQTREGTNRLELSDGGSLSADTVVVATGARPNVGLLDGTPIHVDRGIVVDASMRTSAPHVYAAGDAVISRDLLTGQPINCAIWPVAVEQGTVAGRNMVGRGCRYDGALRANVTNALGLSVASVGLTAEDGEVLSSVFHDPRRQVYRRLFFLGNRLVGAILVGDTRDLGTLSALIRCQVEVSGWQDRLVAQPITYAHVFATAGPRKFAGSCVCVSLRGTHSWWSRCS